MRECIRYFTEFIGDFKLTLPPIIEGDYNTKVSSKEREFIYKTAIPVSEARRDCLRGAEESTAALLEKAGLAGAKILFLFIRLGIDIEELLDFAVSNSIVKYK